MPRTSLLSSLSVLLGLGALLGAGLLGCPASDSTPPRPSTDMAAIPKGDGGGVAGKPDLAMTAGSCPTLTTYCMDPKNFCVPNWPAAMDFKNWCKAGVTAGIYKTSTPCNSGAGDYAIAVGSPTIGSKYYFFGKDSGSFRGVIYFADETVDPVCEAGDPTLVVQSMQGCQFDNPVQCVDGVLQ